MASLDETKIYNTLVGRVDDAFYYLDYITQTGPNTSRIGGFILRPISQDEYDERMHDTDSIEEAWKDAVADDYTTLGLADFESAWEPDEESIFSMDHYSFDPQVREHGFSGEDYPIIETLVSSPDIFNSPIIFSEIFDEGLLNTIKKAKGWA